MVGGPKGGPPPRYRSLSSLRGFGARPRKRAEGGGSGSEQQRGGGAKRWWPRRGGAAPLLKWGAGGAVSPLRLFFLRDAHRDAAHDVALLIDGGRVLHNHRLLLRRARGAATAAAAAPAAAACRNRRYIVADGALDRLRAVGIPGRKGRGGGQEGRQMRYGGTKHAAYLSEWASLT